MAILYRCKCCGSSHVAPTQLVREVAFRSPQMQGYFQDARYRCPEKNEVATYALTDHLWDKEAASALTASVLAQPAQLQQSAA